MKRYELLDFKYAHAWHDQAGLDGALPQERLENFREIPNRTYVRETLPGEFLSVLVLRHLEFAMRPEFVQRSLEAGPKIALDYFYGDWMEDVDVDDNWSRFRDPGTGYLNPAYEETRWLDPYLNGVLLSILNQEPETVQRLSAWVTDNSRYNSGPGSRFTKEDNYFYILLAHRLSGRVSARQSDFESAIGKSRIKRSKLLLECLAAIGSSDEASFHKNFKAFLKRYYQTERGICGFTTLISVEGSILHHMARQAGFAPTPLPDKERALLMTRETLDLK